MAFPRFGLLPDELPEPKSLVMSKQSAAAGPRLGVRTVVITEQGRRNAKPALLPTHGALVSHVEPGSPAARVGIPIGAVITDIDGRRIEGPRELSTAIHAVDPGRELVVTYHFQDKDVSQRVMLDAARPAPGLGPGPSPDDDGPTVEAPAPRDEPKPKTVARRPPLAVEAPRPAPDDAAAMEQLRSDVLERRLRQLEERLQKVEAALRKAEK